MVHCRGETAFDPKSILIENGSGRLPEAYAAHRTIYSQGDAAHSVFYIVRGSVRLNVVSGSGREGVIAVLGAGDFFGEGCLAAQPVRTSSAMATSDCLIVRIARQELDSLLREHPAFAAFFLRFVMSRSARIEEDLVDRMFHTSEQRLARALLLLANPAGEDDAEVTIPRISQEQLAHTVGTTRARVAFFMNSFRKLGYIEYGAPLRGIKIHSSRLKILLQ
jgi:CRP-like cAMP-binding protein